VINARPARAFQQVNPKPARAKRASRSAEVVCLFRAAERWSRAPVLEDPHAVDLLPTGLRFIAKSRRACTALFRIRHLDALRTWVVLRHRALDEALVGFSKSGGRNVFVVGAGLDTRALRFAGSGITLTEIDRPASQAVKRARLRNIAPEGTSVRFLPLELGDGTLASSFGSQSGRALLLWEGVSMYLPPDLVRAVLLDMRAGVNAGSQLAWDFIAPPRREERRGVTLSGALLRLLGEPLEFAATPSAVEKMLTETGWRLDALLDGDALAKRFDATTRPVLPESFVALATAINPSGAVDARG
jgi:methyltransferase (TIGR00027 family)